MISIEEMREICADTDLLLGKTEWFVRIEIHKYEGPFACFVAVTPNSFNPSLMVELKVNSHVLDIVRESKDTFTEWLFQRWLKIVLHEGMEGFRISGGVLRNPHRKPEDYFIEDVA
jgi:hypothetical protein